MTRLGVVLQGPVSQGWTHTALKRVHLGSLDGFPGGGSAKEPACQFRRLAEPGGPLRGECAWSDSGAGQSVRWAAPADPGSQQREALGRRGRRRRTRPGTLAENRLFFLQSLINIVPPRQGTESSITSRAIKGGFGGGVYSLRADTIAYQGFPVACMSQPRTTTRAHTFLFRVLVLPFKKHIKIILISKVNSACQDISSRSV